MSYLMPIILILSTSLIHHKLCSSFVSFYGKHVSSIQEYYKLKFITTEMSIHIVCSVFLLYTIIKHSLFYYDNMEYYSISRYNVSDGEIPGNLVDIPQEYLDIYIFEIIQYIFQIYMYYTKPQEYRDKQHYQLFYHHFFTISLISLSWYTNVFPYGVVVLFLHDFSDIFLDLSKICIILQPREAIGKAVFIAMNISWLVCRLLLLPILVYYINTSCMIPLVRNYLLFDTIVFGDIFFYLLVILCIVQGVWYFLILKFTIRILSIKKWKWSGVYKILNENV